MRPTFILFMIITLVLQYLAQFQLYLTSLIRYSVLIHSKLTLIAVNNPCFKSQRHYIVTLYFVLHCLWIAGLWRTADSLLTSGVLSFAFFLFLAWFWFTALLRRVRVFILCNKKNYEKPTFKIHLWENNMRSCCLIHCFMNVGNILL